MPTTSEPQEAIFESGPFPHIQKSLGLFRPLARAVGARAAVIVLLGWFPLVVLTLADALSGSGSVTALLMDIGTHARSLIAAPLFVLCESICLQRLQVITNHFREAHLIRHEDLPAFHRLIEKCKSLLNSTLLEVLAIVVAYTIVVLILRYVPTRVMPAWFALNGSSHLMSWAGWWYTVVSFPLLVILVFSWLLRVLIWGWFLFKVSRMNLRLIPSHPDHASGLRFLNAQLFAFMPLAFTFGIIGAGAVANRIAYHGGGVPELKRTVIGLVVFVLIVFVGPLLVFVYKLHRQKVSGIYRYDLLADAVGRQFESKWLSNYEKVSSESLEVPDFSATTDLYQIVDNVHQITLAPFELRTVLTLCITALLPFIPVLLMLVPLTVVLKEVASLLFGVG